MSDIKFIALPTEEMREIQNGGLDIHGQPAEVMISSGTGAPCRHCLGEIAAGDEILLFSYCPFPAAQAFAEQGPIFLHKDHCERAPETNALPKIFMARNSIMIRGYDQENRIVYKEGGVVEMSNLKEACQRLFQHPEVFYIHARSALYGCYQCRIERA